MRQARGTHMGRANQNPRVRSALHSPQTIGVTEISNWSILNPIYILIQHPHLIVDARIDVASRRCLLSPYINNAK